MVTATLTVTIATVTLATTIVTIARAILSATIMIVINCRWCRQSN